ncbi:hypothetical protein [Salinirubrum litoreum]|uniref:DUF8151 domain-containing protein n=1 Tax=Salinirubrum litoreum TaxID=1126234 RepID=A0ABD5R808_9EURY|nr:hypothetical protein [Salinirubrum litoreum]
MLELLIETAVEMAPLLFFAVGSGVLSLVGIELERLGLQSLGAGETTLGVWFIFMGIVALYAGIYVVGYHEFRPRLRAYRANAESDTDA